MGEVTSNSLVNFYNNLKELEIANKLYERYQNQDEEKVEDNRNEKIYNHIFGYLTEPTYSMTKDGLMTFWFKDLEAFGYFYKEINSYYEKKHKKS